MEEEEEDKTSQAAMEEEVDKTSQAAMEEEVDKTSQAAMEEEEEDKTRRVAAMALWGVISLQQQDTQILHKLLAMGTPQALINTDRTRR
jgi:hypothetical protein